MSNEKGNMIDSSDEEPDELDPKLRYLIRTLSRTKRKDYENYVVNAIWNRLADDNIKIVTQQYIHNPNDKKGRYRYFIDLYFPALNIGIECYEAFHEKNKKADEEREAKIKEALDEAAMYGALIQKQIDNEKYDQKTIYVNQSYEDVEKQINKCVQEIKDKIKEKRDNNELGDWVVDAENYYENRDEITTDDEVGFRTIEQACKILFSFVPKMEKIHGYFYPKEFENSIYKDHQLWFPKLAIRDDNNKFIAAKKWKNLLANNGETIIEEHEDDLKKSGSEPEKNPRIVFVQYKSSLGNFERRFIGIFKFDRVENGKRYYNRDSKICKIKHIYK